MNNGWKLRSWVILAGGFLNSIPFRLFGGKLAWSSMLGPGYSFFSCQLKNVIIESHVMIGSRAWIQTVPNPYSENPTVLIRERTVIGKYTTISAAKSITIGRGCLFSYNVSVLDHTHAFENTALSPVESGLTKGKPIFIGDHCFIGAHSFIMQGVTLGRNCVVGANSVVTHSFPDYSIIAGSPAKLVRTLPPPAVT